MTILSREIMRCTPLPRRYAQPGRQTGRLVVGVVLAFLLLPQALRPAEPIELRPVDLQLREAASAGEVQRIKALLGQGANPNTVASSSEEISSNLNAVGAAVEEMSTNMNSIAS
ncbi:MAG: hypothetical protein IID61_17925 [SAR324 cluster bacterium]|nr:hypothetical protein [SAR324 cluster bacterium]